MPKQIVGQYKKTVFTGIYADLWVINYFLLYYFLTDETSGVSYDSIAISMACVLTRILELSY